MLRLGQRKCMAPSQHGTHAQILVAMIFCYVILALRCGTFAAHFAAAFLIK